MDRHRAWRDLRGGLQSLSGCCSLDPAERWCYVRLAAASGARQRRLTSDVAHGPSGRPLRAGRHTTPPSRTLVDPGYLPWPGLRFGSVLPSPPGRTTSPPASPPGLRLAAKFVLSSGVLRFAPAGRTDTLRSRCSLRPEALQVGCRPVLGVIRGCAANAANRLTLCGIVAVRSDVCRSQRRPWLPPGKGRHSAGQGATEILELAPIAESEHEHWPVRRQAPQSLSPTQQVSDRRRGDAEQDLVRTFRTANSGGSPASYRTVSASWTRHEYCPKSSAVMSPSSPAARA